MMHNRRPIRLLLREHGLCGGTETVNIHLVKEFIELVDQVVWILPDWRINFFQQILPPSDRLVYRPLYSGQPQLNRVVRKATSFALRQKPLRPARFAVESLRRILFDQWLRQLIREHQITHCFCNWIFSVDVPRINVPIGAMFMDLRWKHFPETFPHIDLNTIDRQFGEWLRKSHVVFPISEITAADIRRFYPWHAGKIRVVPHGAEVNCHHPQPLVPDSLTDSDRLMFFCPAAACGYKNHITLFRACAELFTKGFDFDVVLTGFETENFTNGSTAAARSDGDVAVELARDFLEEHQDLFRGRIKSRGYVPRDEINNLYDRCSAVVLPSYFEGFGLALVEALQHGGTVICSDIPAHHEQLERYDYLDRVLRFAPTDAFQLAAHMEKVLVSAVDASASERAAPETLQRWTWRDAAEAYLDSLGNLTA